MTIPDLGLSEDEKAEAVRMLGELTDRGYAVVEEHNDLRPGVRIRHRGHQYPEAYLNGTGVVVAVTEKKPSGWSESWGAPDIEMVVAYDKPLLPDMSRLTGLAQYHVEVVGR
jgi:hypothetical protein